ncbi:hypothetical protein V8F33_008336 [Rhypophila sp. PSN 637]
MVFGGPGIFRAGILLTALHYSWMSPTGSLAHSDMEETYLYHKLEAMRHVNELVADSQACTTDDCIGLIAALAMAESGMGDTAAAEAHLKGLSTLVNMRRPEEWQHRFWGILQRIILVTGSFIAAAKNPERGGDEQFLSAIDDCSFNTPPPQSSYYLHPTGPVFSTAPFIATRLSPFYMGSTPDLEACKEDAEAEVLMNALRRLSYLTGMDGETASNDHVAALLADTDTYIISLLFKPQPVNIDPALTGSSNINAPDPRTYPYASLPPEQFPSSSRAWASAAYLCLHVILESLWVDPFLDPVTGPNSAAIDNPYLLRLLLDTLKADIQHTEQAMRIGMYSKELWIWMVMVGAYTVAVLNENTPSPGSWIGSPAGDSSYMDPFDQIYQTPQDNNYANQCSYFPPFSSYSSSSGESETEDHDRQSSHRYRSPNCREPPKGSQPRIPEKDYIPSLKQFFSSCIRSWSRTSRVTSWEGARQNMSKIAWPEHIRSVETTTAELWQDAMSTRDQPHKGKGKAHTT